MIKVITDIKRILQSLVGGKMKSRNPDIKSCAARTSLPCRIFVYIDNIPRGKDPQEGEDLQEALDSQRG